MDKNQLEQQIDAIWQQLSVNPQIGYQSIQGYPNLMLMAGKDTLSFLVRYSNSIKPDIKKVKYSNVTISIEQLSANVKVDAIVVTLNVPQFRSIFRTVAVDVFYACLPITNEQERVAEFCRKLNTWSGIFKKGSSTLLSKEEQLGLYGELTFIKALMDDSTVSKSDIIAAWKGPDKEDKDFQYKNYAIEIKSSANQMNHPKINNIRQLDETGLTALYLYHYSFARTDGGIRTLPALIADVRNCLYGSASADMFEEKLTETGYLDSDAGSYTSNYTLQDEDAYLVDASFPKITASMCPGILNVEYYIDLAPYSNHIVQYMYLIDILNKA